MNWRLETLMFKLTIAFSFVFLSLQAHADFTYDFVRISCIQESEFLDIEYRDIHNNAVDAVAGDQFKNRFLLWAKHGFFDPRKLSYKCTFTKKDRDSTTHQSTYKVVTKKAEQGNGPCGGAPEIYLSLYKNDQVLINNVVFGNSNSCYGSPAISRIYIQGQGPEEAQICFRKNSNTGEEPPKDKCEWSFGKEMFPIDQSKVGSFLYPKSPPKVFKPQNSK